MNFLFFLICTFTSCAFVFQAISIADQRSEKRHKELLKKLEELKK